MIILFLYLLQDLNTFSDWCTGASPVSLKINNAVYTLQPGGFAYSIYTLNYNNTAAITRNITGTSDYLGIEDGFPVEKTAGLSFTLYVGEIKQINKKYIPDELFTQANWNENNETSPAYIQNRICYEETVPDTYEELQLTTSNWQSLTGYVKGSDLSKMLSIPLNFIVNGVKHYNISPEWYFGSKTKIAYFFNESKTVYVSVTENAIAINGVSLGWYPSSNNISFLKIIKHENLVKQIDSKYIPIDSTPTEGSTNAASSDALAKLVSNIDGFFNALPESVVAVKLDQSKIFTDNQKQIARNNIGAISSSELVQSDWNQNDTSASDYIKNKPTIDTALSSTSENAVQNKVVKAAIDEVQNTVKEYIGSKVSDKELILFSSTENSTKKFKITVNDSGTISAKEVTEGA